MEKEQVQENVTESVGTVGEDGYEPLLVENGELIVVPELMLTRRQYSSRGQKYWSYRIESQLRGRDIAVEFVCRNDVGGYKWLDSVFGDASEVMFAVRFVKRYDRKTKVMSKGYEYYAVAKDDEIDDYVKAPLSPAHNSDTAILDTLLKRVEKKYGISFEG